MDPFQTQYRHRIIIRTPQASISIINHLLKRYKMPTSSVTLTYAKGCYDILILSRDINPKCIGAMRNVVPHTYFASSYTQTLI